MSKLSVMVDFPIHGLDVTSHLASRTQTCNGSNPEIQSKFTDFVAKVHLMRSINLFPSLQVTGSIRVSGWDGVHCGLR
jgi:hypothetical protein